MKFRSDKIIILWVKGLENKWFPSFLALRKQFVSFSGFLSDTRIVQYGVPQSSILGLLFSFYINDPASVFKHWTIHHFFDDTKFFYANTSDKNKEKILKPI